MNATFRKLMVILLKCSCLVSLALAEPGSTPPSALPSGLAPAETRRLTSELERAFKNEVASLNQPGRVEMRELKSSQRARRNDFDSQEKSKRHEFFATAPKGPEIREYMKAFKERQKTLFQGFDDELKKRHYEADIKLKSLRADQELRSHAFKEQLQAGKRPESGLWQPGWIPSPVPSP